MTIMAVSSTVAGKMSSTKLGAKFASQMGSIIPEESFPAEFKQLKKKFGVVVEQAEDEISAINMVQGAWLTGGRAMTTTSGGGFALMEEGISNADLTQLCHH